MFCNQCGTELKPDYNLCPKCGQPVGRAAVPAIAAPHPSNLQQHLRILGTLWIIAGALFLIPSVFMMGIGGMAHMFIPGEVAIARVLGPLVLYMIGASLLVLGAGGVAVGWGLMQHRTWARVAALVLGVLALFHPPIGTALGIYTLWVLLSGNAGPEYDRLARA